MPLEESVRETAFAEPLREDEPVAALMEACEPQFPDKVPSSLVLPFESQEEPKRIVPESRISLVDTSPDQSPASSIAEISSGVPALAENLHEHEPVAAHMKACQLLFPYKVPSSPNLPLEPQEEATCVMPESQISQLDSSPDQSPVSSGADIVSCAASWDLSSVAVPDHGVSLESLDHKYSECLQVLREAPWPDPTNARDDTVEPLSLRALSGCWHFGVQCDQRDAVTAISKALPETLRYLNVFLARIWPQGSWNAVSVSCNCKTAPRRNTDQAPQSCHFTVSLGDFLGGGLWLEDTDGNVRLFVPEVNAFLPGRVVITRESPFQFDGQLWHAHRPWSGERWVLTAYTVPGADASALKGFGFPCKGCSSVPKPPALPAFELPAAPRFFLDICSGVHAPLARAALQRGIPSLAVDVLLNSDHDLCNDLFFEQLLRVAFSGRVQFGHGSPPCCEYSLLKLMPGPGPLPCRSPEHLNGLPSNGPAEDQRVASSRLILTRTISILYAVYQAGGHVSLEQPRNAMSWLEPATQGFLLDISADLVVVAACAFESDFFKHWIFASSWRPLQALQSICQHPKHFHPCYAGKTSSEGHFLSRETAEFPAPLAQRFMALLDALFPSKLGAAALSFPETLASLPVRPLHSFPRACQDGGGIYSVPDSATPQPGVPDLFKVLRADLRQLLLQWRIPCRLRRMVADASAQPVFSTAEVRQLRTVWEHWFRAVGFSESVDWTVAEGQPYSLQALELLAKSMQDRDVALWPALQAGVPTGVAGDIPLSNTLIPLPTEHSPQDDADFQICGNWPGAEQHPELLEEMIQAEVEAGYLECVDSLHEAQQRWPQIAVGKANIVQAVGRKPRLIIDPTVSGTNPACTIPERFTLPGLGDIQAGFPIRGCSSEVGGFSLDIASAHKTVRVREAERGLLGVKVKDKYYFYRVAPFGGAFSAHWWQRIAGFFMRSCHRIVWIAHVMIMYVDDALFWQAIGALDLSASLILSFCQVFNFPISWRKLQLGPVVEYIGWQIHFRAGAFCLPTSKVDKLLQAIEQILSGQFCTCRELEAIIGLLHWVVQMATALRPWLCVLYHDKARPLGTNFSLSPAVWQQLSTYLDAEMRFTSTPPGTSIRSGSKLLSVRHVQIDSLADLRLVRATGKRLWARVADPSTGKRKLSVASQRFLLFWKAWCLKPQVFRPLSLPPFTPEVSLAADACASGCHIGIGGWVLIPGQHRVWFAESFQVSDFQALGIPVGAEANLDIVSYETLAQIALVVTFASMCAGGRLRIAIPSWTDNSGTESTCNKLFTTVVPLCLFAQRLATLAWSTSVTLDTSHIAGCHNDSADWLSRWCGQESLPEDFLPELRVRCPLSVLWEGEKDVRLFPPNAQLTWQPPLSSGLI